MKAAPYDLNGSPVVRLEQLATVQYVTWEEALTLAGDVLAVATEVLRRARLLERRAEEGLTGKEAG